MLLFIVVINFFFVLAIFQIRSPDFAWEGLERDSPTQTSSIAENHCVHHHAQFIVWEVGLPNFVFKNYY
jgi:hypothetical protein